MTPDNSHAESRILARTIEQYDQRRFLFPEESEAQVRTRAVAWFSELARLDYITAAERLADALALRASQGDSPLARRAANKLENSND